MTDHDRHHQPELGIDQNPGPGVFVSPWARTRTVTHPDAPLTVFEDEPDDTWYVLVIAVEPPATFGIVGGITGREAKRIGERIGGDAYRVHQRQLVPAEMLPDVARGN